MVFCWLREEVGVARPVLRLETGPFVGTLRAEEAMVGAVSLDAAEARAERGEGGVLVSEGGGMFVEMVLECCDVVGSFALLEGLDLVASGIADGELDYGLRQSVDENEDVLLPGE